MSFTITTKMHTVRKNKLKMCNSYRRNHVKRETEKKPSSWKKKQQKHVTGSVCVWKA